MLGRELGICECATSVIQSVPTCSARSKLTFSFVCHKERKLQVVGFAVACCWVAQPLRETDPDRTMASTRTLKDPSIGQHFRRILICTVLLQMLLQALSVAVTYMYFNNEMKQVSSQVLSATLCFAPQLAPL